MINGGNSNFFVDDIFVYGCPTVGINETNLDQHITVSPNPASDELNIKFQGLTSGSILIEIFDIEYWR